MLIAEAANIVFGLTYRVSNRRLTALYANLLPITQLMRFLVFNIHIDQQKIGLEKINYSIEYLSLLINILLSY